MVAPIENFVYADTLGHIAYQVPGSVPVRTVPWHTGRFPVPGNGSYAWRTSPDGYFSFLEYHQLPRLLDPETQVIVTANNQVGTH